MLIDMKPNGKIMLISSLIIMTIFTTPISPTTTTTIKSQHVFAESNSGLTSKNIPYSNNQFDDKGGSNAPAEKDDVKGKIIEIKKANHSVQIHIMSKLEIQ